MVLSLTFKITLKSSDFGSANPKLKDLPEEAGVSGLEELLQGLEVGWKFYWIELGFQQDTKAQLHSMVHGE